MNFPNQVNEYEYNYSLQCWFYRSNQQVLFKADTIVNNLEACERNKEGKKNLDVSEGSEYSDTALSGNGKGGVPGQQQIKTWTTANKNLANSK